ncbi:MAG: FAD-dependent monooxygenase [Solirubrobacteraceae bacterium]
MNRVLIVGGGPAGMTAAIALARRGIGCEIVEREVQWRPALLPGPTLARSRDGLPSGGSNGAGSWSRGHCS